MVVASAKRRPRNVADHQGIGQSVRRSEDLRLLTGRGRYADDINLAGQAYAAFVRSPYAHADIGSIDTRAAAATPQVLGVFTGADLDADGVKPIQSLITERGAALRNRDGSRFREPIWRPLAVDRARHVGEPVAFVVAETPEGAIDGAERVVVHYTERPQVVDMTRVAEGPQIHVDIAGNRIFDWETGDRIATDLAFTKASQIAQLDVVNNRLVASYIEPRAAIGDWDVSAQRYTFYGSLQSVHQLAQRLAEIFDEPVEKFHVVTTDVGGGFGPKLHPYPEYVGILWAARRLDRPVKWTSTRSELFVSDAHSRDHLTHGALALDAEGNMLGLRVYSVANFGAYISSGAPTSTILNMARMASAAYAIPAIHLTVEGVLTNTVPINVYRGVGRAEAIYIVERLLEQAARETGGDRVAVRARNLVTAAAMPHTTPTGAIYDSGDYAGNMKDALGRANWQAFSARSSEAAGRGRLRGIGVSYYIEGAGGVPQEYAKLRIDPEGFVELPVGSQSQGQSHETTFAQVAADQLGIGFDSIRIVMGDTDRVASGVGTFASRSMIRAGGAIVEAVGAVLELGKEMAGHVLEAAPADIEYANGQFGVVGTDRRIGLFDLARCAEAGDMPAQLGVELAAEQHHENPQFAYPNGCQVCEIEIDPETGASEIIGFVVTDDVGRAVNPMVVTGQTHGAVVQGIGQALLENCVYDDIAGQLLAGSFMDYAIPRADEVPFIETANLDVPSPTNALGVKGAGEGGTVGAPPAVIHAILDALAPFGTRHIDMPATPERIWRAIRMAEGH